MHTQVPSDFPEPMQHYCYAGDRFYMTKEEAENNWQYFKLYAQRCLTREPVNAYAQLVKAAASQNIGDTVRLTHEMGLVEHPFMFNGIRQLLRDKILEHTFSDPIWLLYRAPWMIIKGEMCQETLYSLVREFPAHAEELLKHALIHQTAAHWELLAQDHRYAGLAYLAIMNRDPRARTLLVDIYKSNPSSLNLACLCIANPQTGIEWVSSHPVIAQKFNILSIMGHAAVLSTLAHELLLIPFMEARDSMRLMFGIQARIRDSMSINGSSRQHSYDPIHIKQLCKDLPPVRDTTKTLQLISNGAGAAISLMKINRVANGN